LQDSTSNRHGDYKQFENHLAERLKNGEILYIKVIDFYKGDALTPFKRTATVITVHPNGTYDEEQIEFQGSRFHQGDKEQK